MLMALGEGDAEHTDEVAILSLGLNEGLDEGVPFLDEGAELVSGDVHSVEVGEAVHALNFFALDFNLSPGHLVSLTVHVCERDFEDTASEGVSSDLY